MSPAYLISSTGVITLYHNSNVHTIDRTHKNYEAIKDILTKTKEYTSLENLVNVVKVVEKSFQESGTSALKIENGEVLYFGEPLHNAVVTKILEFIDKKLDFAPLLKFLENLMENPSKASVDNLYRFLEHNQMPITVDGHFIAYKGVTQDYKDCKTGKLDNSPGKIVEMPRNKVQDDPNITCSYGLHVAALGYVNGEYGGYHKIVVKVNPRDVVSVPTDYNNQKMRVCRYEVLHDLKTEVKQEDIVELKKAPPEPEKVTQPVDNGTYGGYSAVGVASLGSAGAVIAAGATGGNSLTDGGHAAVNPDDYEEVRKDYETLAGTADDDDLDDDDEEYDDEDDYDSWLDEDDDLDDDDDDYGYDDDEDEDDDDY